MFCSCEKGIRLEVILYFEQSLKKSSNPLGKWVTICQPDLKIQYIQPIRFVMWTVLTKYENQYIQIKTGYNYGVWNAITRFIINLDSFFPVNTMFDFKFKVKIL